MQMYIVFLLLLHAYYIIFHEVNNIYDTKPTFSYFIIYSVRYERPIRACLPDIYPDIWYLIWKTPIRYDPDFWYLKPWLHTGLTNP